MTKIILFVRGAKYNTGLKVGNVPHVRTQTAFNAQQIGQIVGVVNELMVEEIIENVLDVLIVIVTIVKIITINVKLVIVGMGLMGIKFVYLALRRGVWFVLIMPTFVKSVRIIYS